MVLARAGEPDRMRVAFVLLTVVTLLPVASACDWPAPAMGTVLLWTDGDSLLANRDYEIGFLESGGAFTPVAQMSSAPGIHVVADPSGERLAYVESSGVGADCERHDPRLVMFDIESGETREVTRESAEALAASATHVAYSTPDAVRLVGWDGGDERALPFEGLASGMAFSPDGARLLAVGESDGALFDVATGERSDVAVDVENGFVSGVAFHVDGTHAAILVLGIGSRALLEVWRVDAPQPERIGTRTDQGQAIALAWGPAGLATLHRDYGASPGAWLRVFPDSTELEQAWSLDLGQARVGNDLLPTHDGEGFLLSVDDEVRRIEPGDPGEVQEAARVGGPEPAFEPPARDEVPGVFAPLALVLAGLLARWRPATRASSDSAARP